MSESSTQVETTEQLAQRLFRDLHQSIIQHESGAMAGKVEAIHDMRVGIRRLRGALNNFADCLPKEDRRRLRATLERLAQSLGSARDLDVMIHALRSKQADNSEEDRAHIIAFIRRLRARRRRRHQQLIGYLQSEEFISFKGEFQANDITETLGNGELHQ
jgi:CHAD domain-containing protein